MYLSVRKGSSNLRATYVHRAMLTVLTARLPVLCVLSVEEESTFQQPTTHVWTVEMGIMWLTMVGVTRAIVGVERA